jgi:hypothetical protein
MQDDDRRLVTAILSGEPDRFAGWSSVTRRACVASWGATSATRGCATSCADDLPARVSADSDGWPRPIVSKRGWRGSPATRSPTSWRRRTTNDREVGRSTASISVRAEPRGKRKPAAGSGREVACLAPDARRVLELRYRDGLTYAGRRAPRVPASTVRGRIYEARGALRRRLEAMEGEP